MNLLFRLARLAFVPAVLLSLGQWTVGVPPAASSEGRTDRNLVAVGKPGPRLPAIPASDIRVSKGYVTVRFGYQKVKLETLTAQPPGAGPFPLAVVSHGMPTRGGRKARRNVRIRSLLPIAEDFARRGYKAVVFARRGFASSGGETRESYGRCKRANAGSYVRAGEGGAEDYAGIIRTLADAPDVDGTTVVVAGQSAGGFASIALAAEPPPGLVAVVNFAGGRGGAGEDGNCSPTGFVGAFGNFGRRARVPSLWLYSTTDRLFGPELVEKAFSAYAEGGAPARIEWVGPLWYSRDGHRLAHLGGRELWRPRIDAFLNDIGAPNWEVAPDDAAVVRLPPPSSLGNRGRERWRRYLAIAGHKAFALGPGGRFGWSALRDSADSAVEDAMGYCQQRGDTCRVVSIDGEMVQ